jgi:arginine-tRNA-protein transferase
MDVSPPFFNDPDCCSYLPLRDSRMEYRVAFELSADEYAGWILRGWRRFGRSLFRPRCQGCDACRSIRVDVARFRPDRSQRRALKANRDDLRLEVADPVAGPEQLDLYRRFHAHQAGAKQWPSHQDDDEGDYRRSFVDNPFATREWRYYLGEALVGVGYVDPLPIGPSAIYFVHDPAHRDRSLGTYNVLALIDHARSLGQPHVYLGYYVADCPSLAYKARFAPNQVLGRDGLWQDFRAWSGSRL